MFDQVICHALVGVGAGRDIIVAFVHDDPWTLSRVERLYRSHALAGVSDAPAESGQVVSGDARGLAA